MRTIQTVTWGLAVLFGLVVITGAIPYFNPGGLQFGLFKIDPIDNFVHILTAIFAAFASWHSIRLSTIVLKVISVIYGIDAFCGLVLSRGFLDLSFITEGIGSPDFGITNLLINAPHVGIVAVAAYTAWVIGRPRTA